MSHSLPLVLVLAAALLLVAPVLHWRALVFVLLGWVLVEGLVRKLLPGQPPEVILVSDALLALMYASYGIRKAIRARKAGASWVPPFFLAMVVFALFCVIDVFNPGSPSVWIGLVGLHSYLWCLPLLWIGHETCSDLDSVNHLCWWLVVSTIPMAAIALYQHLHFHHLPAALSTLAGDPGMHSTGAKDIDMVPATFVNAEEYSRYCLMTMLMSFGLLLEGYGGRPRKALAMLGMAASFAGIFLSGRRSPFYLAILGMAWIALIYRRKLAGRRALPFAAGICVLALAATGLYNFSATDATYFRTSVGEFGTRANWAWRDMKKGFQNAGTLGAGTGINSQGVRYLPGGKGLIAAEGTRESETGLGQVSDELGIVGLGFFLLFWGSIIRAGVSNLRRLRGRPGHPIAASLFTFFVLLLGWFAKGHQIFGDSSTLIHLWLFMGIFLALPTLRRCGDAKAAERAAPRRDFAFPAMRTQPRTSRNL